MERPTLEDMVLGLKIDVGDLEEMLGGEFWEKDGSVYRS